MTKLPSLQFYPGDWMKDPALRAVTIAARGLWIDMLCLMHESPRRGYLQHETGKAVTAEQLARMTGCSTDSASLMLQELEDAGVFSRTPDQIIYSRRIVRDERKRQLCADAGKRGGGNPTLKGHPKGRSKGGPNPSSSSSVSSSASNAEDPPYPPRGGRDCIADVSIPDTLNTPAFIAAWDEWVQHRRENRSRLTTAAAKRQLAKFAEWGEQRAIAAIHHSVQNGWTGVFEPQAASVGSQRETDGERTLRIMRERNATGAAQ